jgi:hypothetical protein
LLRAWRRRKREDGSKREWKIEYEFEHGLGVED